MTFRVTEADGAGRTVGIRLTREEVDRRMALAAEAAAKERADDPHIPKQEGK